MPGRSAHCVFDSFLRCVESGLEQNGRPPHLRRRGSQRTVGCLPPSVWGPSGRRGPPQIRLPPISRFWAEAPSPLDPDPGPGMASRSWVNKGLAALELQ